MSSVVDYLRWYHDSDADGDVMDTAELAVAYAKHCLSEELREVFAIHKAEIDALKAERDALLAALNATLIELTYTVGQLEHFTELKKGLAVIEAINQAKAAIAKARGDL